VEVFLASTSTWVVAAALQVFQFLPLLDEALRKFVAGWLFGLS
jgi:hypothetical protein